MRSLDLILGAARGVEREPGEERPEADELDLLLEEVDAEEGAEALDDGGFDISEFDEEDEEALYDEDDELFIAGDEDLPDEPEDDEDEDEASDWSDG